ncbi:MAG: alcohol dehydrogenase catalytic domain-containing protein [Acidimicrobiia bacterium]|nr:alcohol dehydrogenase catalytic domain-containing protein [Acidimicrobiia bacterium]
MRALRFHGPGDLRLDDVPRPVPGDGEVLVRVDACGVCGSDLHFLDGSARTAYVPITLGHEIAGTVEASRHPAYSAGEQVLVLAGGACGSCGPCRSGRRNLCERMRVVGIDFDGGLAEAVAVPGAMLIPRPAAVDAVAAATAVDAGATARHAVLRRGGVGPGSAVLVIGAGGLGTYGLQIARRAGATPTVVADTDPEALDRARALGADEVVAVEPGMSLGRTVKLLTDGGVDVALEFVGRASTVDAAVKSLRPGGTAVAVGVGTEPLATIPPVLWSNNEYTLTGSYGSLEGDAEAVLEGIGDGSLTPPPIERVSLDDAAAVVSATAAGRRPSPGRIVVIP